MSDVEIEPEGPITPEAPAPDEPPPPDEPDEPEAGAVFDVEAFVKALPDGVCLCPLCLGLGAVVEEPPFDPTTHQCGTCLGQGKVRTGSLRSNEAERDCTPCNGRGWLLNEPGEPEAGPARARDLEVAEPRDFAGRSPADKDFDWSRVVHPAPAVEVPA